MQINTDIYISVNLRLSAFYCTFFLHVALPLKPREGIAGSYGLGQESIRPLCILKRSQRPMIIEKASSRVAS